jgi:Protein of unknown function (DUF3108)
MPSTLRSGLAAVLLSAASASGAFAQDAWPSRVTATYDVEFAGVSIGAFDFNSANNGQTYTLNGGGKLSLLFGALKWNGSAESSGKLTADAPQPQSFGFTFKSSSKSGGTRMTYTGNTITSVVNEPNKPPKEGSVPVQPQHLVNVLDPMSAMLAVSKGASGNPCSRRIPIYDGRARYDLIFSPKGTVQLTEQRPSGQPATGYVCRIKYVPIAGHKPDEANSAMAKSNDIEIVLRPIPSANVFIPYRVSVPTMAGTAVLKAKRVDITMRGQQIALSH